MKFVHVDLDRLGPVVIREVPTARTQSDKVTPLVNGNGEQVYTGRVLIPGTARSAFADPLPGQVRLKLEGNPPPGGLEPGAIVRLGGLVKLSAWYQRGARGAAATSQATITAERITVVTGEAPQLMGYVPVSPPVSDPFIALGVEQDGDQWDLVAMVPQAVVDQQGVVKVRLSAKPDDGLIGMPVRFVDMAAKVIQPDSEDVGRSAKAELAFFATAVMAATPEMATAGPARRNSQDNAKTTEGGES